MKRFQKSCAIMTSYSLLLILVHIFHFDIFRQIEFWCIVTKIIISSFTSFWWRIICEKWRFSSLHTLQYIRTKIEKKNVATNIKSWPAADISKMSALFLSLLLTVIELGSMTHWIILQFWFHSNWFEGQTTTEEIYTWKFFYNTTSNVFFCSIGTWFEFFSSFQSENTSTV